MQFAIFTFGLNLQERDLLNSIIVITIRVPIKTGKALHNNRKEYFYSCEEERSWVSHCNKSTDLCRLAILKRWWWMHWSMTSQTLYAFSWTMAWTWESSLPMAVFRSFTGLSQRKASFTTCSSKSTRRSSFCSELPGHMVHPGTILLSKETENPASPSMRSPKCWKTFSTTLVKAFTRRLPR